MLYFSKLVQLFEELAHVGTPTVCLHFIDGSESVRVADVHLILKHFLGGKDWDEA